ncbi:MAG: zinc-binding dehydrogenase [Rhodobacter sp.]|nr:zinc-binding dehydrogenase [Rhodobacter sp.]
MKAAVFMGLGHKLAIQDMARPEPGPGQVVIEVAACGVCGSDLHATDAGVFLQENGTVLGHEFSGTVVASGDAAVPVGLRATAVPVNACTDPACQALGTCKYDLGILCPQNRITGLAKSVPGAYAQFVKVGARQVVALPDGVTWEEGAMVEPLAVGLHAVTKSDMEIGARVLIIGAGPIGLSVAAFAALRGAGAVVVSERAPARRAAASAFGATAVVDPTKVDDLGDEFARLAGGPPDVIFDCVGAPGIIQTCVNLSRARGTIVVVGVCMKEDTLIPISAILKEVKLQFILGYVDADFAKVLAVLQAGKINAAAMVTDRVALSDLPDAFEGLRQPGSQIKMMILPQG